MMKTLDSVHICLSVFIIASGQNLFCTWINSEIKMCLVALVAVQYML